MQISLHIYQFKFSSYTEILCVVGQFVVAIFDLISMISIFTYDLTVKVVFHLYMLILGEYDLSNVWSRSLR